MLLTRLHDDPDRTEFPGVSGELGCFFQQGEEEVNEEHVGEVVYSEAGEWGDATISISDPD